MKKLLIAMIIAGTTMSAMAQMFAVLDVKIKGAVLLEGEEPETMEIDKGGLKGWIITPVEEGSYDGPAIFIEAEKGWYEQLECHVAFEAFSNSSFEGDTKHVEKGVASLSFYTETDIDEMENVILFNSTLGKFTYTETEGNEKFTMATKGSGIIAYDEMALLGYLNSVKTKVNAKLTAGINAAGDPEAFLEEALSMIVKDEVDIDFGVFY